MPMIFSCSPALDAACEKTTTRKMLNLFLVFLCSLHAACKKNKNNYFFKSLVHTFLVFLHCAHGACKKITIESLRAEIVIICTYIHTYSTCELHPTLAVMYRIHLRWFRALDGACKTKTKTIEMRSYIRTGTLTHLSSFARRLAWWMLTKHINTQRAHTHTYLYLLSYSSGHDMRLACDHGLDFGGELI